MDFSRADRGDERAVGDPSDVSGVKEYLDRIAESDWALRSKPDDVDLRLDRANAYLHLAQYEQAISDYTEVIRLNPDMQIRISIEASRISISGTLNRRLLILMP